MCMQKKTTGTKFCGLCVPTLGELGDVTYRRTPGDYRTVLTAPFMPEAPPFCNEPIRTQQHNATTTTTTTTITPFLPPTRRHHHHHTITNLIPTTKYHKHHNNNADKKTRTDQSCQHPQKRKFENHNYISSTKSFKTTNSNFINRDNKKTKNKNDMKQKSK